MTLLPDCHDVFVDIVLLLDTWPSRLRDGQKWSAFVDTAYQYAIALNMDNAHSALLLLKSKSAFEMRRYGESQEYAERAFREALDQQQAIVAARCVSHLITVLLARRQPDQTLLGLLGRLDSAGIIHDRSSPLARLYTALAYVQAYRHVGRLDDLAPLIGKIEKEVLPHVDRRSQGVWHHNMGLNLWRTGNHKEAIKRYRRAIKLFERVGDVGVMGIIADLGLVLWNMGRLDEADDQLTKAYRAVGAGLDYVRMMKIEGHLALVYAAQGHLDTAYTINESAIQKAKTIGATGDLSRLIGNRGAIAIHRGDYEQARQDLEHDHMALTAPNQHYACTLANLARVYNLLGMKNEALDCAAEALQLCRDKGYRPMLIIALRVMAECTPDPYTALDCLQEALALSTGHQLLDEAACHLALATLDNVPGKKKRHWARGSALLKSIGADEWLQGSSPTTPPLILLMG